MLRDHFYGSRLDCMRFQAASHQVHGLEFSSAFNSFEDIRLPVLICRFTSSHVATLLTASCPCKGVVFRPNILVRK